MAKVRAELAPRPDDERYTLEVCEDCGDTFPRRKGRRRHRCPDCAAARMVVNCDATRARAGEAYERIVLAQLNYWLAEAIRLDLLKEVMHDGAA